MILRKRIELIADSGEYRGEVLKIIKEKEIVIKTKAQWEKEGRYVLPEFDHHECADYSYGNSHSDYFYYYSKKKTRMIPKKIREEEKRMKNEQAYNRRHEKKFMEEHPWWNEEHTSWQWLRLHHRIPINYDDGFGIVQGFDTFTNESGEVVEVRHSAWTYYKGRDTVAVTAKLYDHLKDLYIKKYGGWEKIDLDHTEYDGHIWWSQNDLAGFDIPEKEQMTWPPYKLKKSKKGAKKND